MDETREGEGAGLLDKVKDMLGGGESSGERTGRESGDAGYAERTDGQSYGGMPLDDTSRFGQTGMGTGNDFGARSERDTGNEGGYSEYGEDRDRDRDRDLDTGNTRDVGGY